MPPVADLSPLPDDEPRAWEEVQACWSDRAAHLAYLARFPDLDGLATAGRHYRDALAARPGDVMALDMKAEVVRRAAVVGLAMLPRTAPPRVASPAWRRAVVLVLAAWVVVAGGWMAWKLLTGPTP
jgi:hypothetical protein